jgi:hypothetical protein
VIDAIEAVASRPEAAERYEISASVVVLWTQLATRIIQKPIASAINAKPIFRFIGEHYAILGSESVMAITKNRFLP